MESIPVSKFKAQCLGILEEVRKHKKKIIITKRGVPIAEIRPLELSGQEKPPLKETVVFMGDLVSPVAQEDWEVLAEEERKG